MPKEKVLEIDVNELKDGTCKIVKGFQKSKFAVCREGDKIKIYPVTLEEE